MKVLSIGTDRKLFEKGSKVSERNVSYGNKTESMHIIVFALQSHQILDTKYQLSPHVFVYSTDSSSRWMYIWDAIRLGKKIIVEEKFIRGQSVITTQDPFECGFVGWRLSRIFRLPLHLQIHTDFLSPYFKTSFHQRLRVMVAKFLLPRVAGVRVVSQRISDSIIRSGIRLKRQPQILPILVEQAPDLRKNLSGSAGSVSLLGSSSLKDFFSSPEQKPFAFTILMASRLTKEKRIGDALIAFKQVLDNFSHAGLVIAGVGPEKATLQNQAIQLGIEKSIVFLGWQDDLPSLMRQSQMFLSTSEFEGYGMSMIEAGLARLPIVTTNVGIAGEILTDEENALVCPIGDVVCIAGKILRLINDIPLRLKLSEKLQDDIRTSLPSQEKYVAEYVRGLEAIQSDIQ